MKTNAIELRNSSDKDSAFQKCRKEKSMSNLNRVNQRFNTYNPTQNLTSLDNNDGQKIKGTKDFNAALESFLPQLESLPSKVLHRSRFFNVIFRYRSETRLRQPLWS